ncbi:Membrane-associated protease RseP [Commensalibacter communis]|uniref:Zinc metalloprotease n=2 Tax=Commensalibacter communis TaxID=2972786 RepID=A0A9W4TM98_9PROT|nr:RIP metalloprotease RseP [Commensalibacter communis]CAI3923612.1 Membrane-associated protease RseP [Commensalibacter communis]CAI3924140.1 Membrane-associated protease RseP [Commensalibacter communis]CAI3945930.1 Membrane-associated protease RseP [Commensalibacter communis]CAI3946513.1 Membrane-associated protease RseP [Commensalibacter communis]CAI3947385.1 Membrane-associated protease RseP [Commensalibacter communis]
MSMLAIYDFLRMIISFVFVLGVLVFIHELGHYLAARWRGIHVDVFSIGFGKPLYRWHDKVGTEWRICPIPLGGYVRPHGFADPEDVSEEERAAYIEGKTFHGKDVGSRAIVIAAGPIFNFLLAIILYFGLFVTVGKHSLGEPVAQAIIADSAAAKAGIQPKDVILKIGDINHPGVENLVMYAQEHPDLSTTIAVKRDGKEVTLPITIGSKENDGKKVGQLGVQLAINVIAGKPMSVGGAAVAAVQETWDVSKKTLVGLGQMITGQRSAKDLGGPIKIAQLSGQVSKGGFADLVNFMALLSISLGLINLFPIPVLDGGRLVFYVFEAIFRRPVPKPIQERAFQVGFVLILLLFAFSMYNDVTQLSWFRWLTGHSN